jgi:uncharacterized protein (DUF305 family)
VSDDGASRRRFIFGAAAAGTVGFAAGAIAPIGMSSASDAPNEADIGFCTDMTTHHVQALAMCQRVLGRDNGDAVQAAAAEVLQNQAIEVGMMRAWLTDWRASTSQPSTVMAWMPDMENHRMTVDMMPGYATDIELDELSSLTGLDQGRKWLELMHAHHVGGVAMAEAAIGLAASAKVVRLARQQAATQTFEITQYDQLLTGAYA